MAVVNFCRAEAGRPLAAADVMEMRRSSFRPWTFENDVLFCPNIHLVYTAVSKNACSTMKAFLWHLENYPKFLPPEKSPHNRKSTGLQGAVELGDAGLAQLLSDPTVPKVTVVRNPYSRAASCYFNRVAAFGTESYDLRSRMTEWIHNRIAILSWRHRRPVGLPEAAATEITFRDFIEFICSQPDYRMDRHWVSQRQATYIDTIRYDHVGKVEDLDAAMAAIVDLAGCDSAWSSDSALNRGAGKKDLSSLFDPDLQRLFVERFEADFEIFDYSTDLRAC